MNTFDLTIKHNLDIVLQNALNMFKACEFLTEEEELVFEQMRNAREMLSLIEPEGEQPEWISVNEKLPTERVFTCLCFNGDAPEYNQHIFIATWFSQEQKFSQYKQNVLGTITHWRPLPDSPVTLSEASKHNFQQGVEWDGKELSDEAFI